MKVNQITAAVTGVIVPVKTVQSALKPHMKVIADLKDVVTQREDMIKAAVLRRDILKAQLADINDVIVLHNDEIADANRMVKSLEKVLS